VAKRGLESATDRRILTQAIIAILMTAWAPGSGACSELRSSDAGLCSSMHLVDVVIKTSEARPDPILCSPRVLACSHHWTGIYMGHGFWPRILIRVKRLTRFGTLIAVREGIERDYDDTKRVPERPNYNEHLRIASPTKPAETPLHALSSDSRSLSATITVHKLPTPTGCAKCHSPRCTPDDSSAQ
jgi:hypothetical protein